MSAEYEEAKQEIVEELAEVEQTLAEAILSLEELPLRIRRLREQLHELHGHPQRNFENLSSYHSVASITGERQ